MIQQDTPPPLPPADGAPPPTAPPPPFLPFDICGACVAFVFRNLPTVLRLGLVPYLVGVGVYALTLYLFPGTPDPGDILVKAPAGELIDFAVIVLASAMFAVGVHRYVIGGVRPGWPLHARLRREELLYILTAILWFLLYLASFLALAGAFAATMLLRDGQFADAYPWARPAAAIAALVLFWLLIWAALRLALAFPHAAVTGRFGFAASWRAMRGQCWKLFFILLVASILAQLIVLAFGVLALGGGYGLWTLLVDEPVLDTQTGRFDYGPAAGYAVPSLIVLAVAAYGVVIGFSEAALIAALSMAYRALVEGRPIEDAAAPPPVSPAPPPWPEPDRR